MAEDGRFYERSAIEQSFVTVTGGGRSSVTTSPMRRMLQTGIPEAEVARMRQLWGNPDSTRAPKRSANAASAASMEINDTKRYRTAFDLMADEWIGLTTLVETGAIRGGTAGARKKRMGEEAEVARMRKLCEAGDRDAMRSLGWLHVAGTHGLAKGPS